MGPSRRLSNGRSPLVNQQRQITNFFSPTKTSTSPSSTSPAVSKQNPKSDPANPESSPSPTTTPQTKEKKPLLIIGPSTDLSPPMPPPEVVTTPDSGKRLYGDEVIGKKLKVYWPLDKCWYEGCVKSFDMLSCKHLVQYEDAEEEELDLQKEKIEWVEEVPRSFRRLRRNLVPENIVLDAEENSERISAGDDSVDEDWGKNVGKEMVEDDSEEMDLDEEEEEEEEEEEDGEVKSSKVSHSRTLGSRKRKMLKPEKLGSGKKIKGGGNVQNSASKHSLDDKGTKLAEPVNRKWV